MEWSQTQTAEMAKGSVGDGFEAVCSFKELRAAGRKRVTLNERVVAVFYVGGEVHALDHFCYHAGGPLDIGDIEDSHGRMCVVCPWHKHSITLDTGESLYTSFNPLKPKEVKHNCSKGVKQRVHHVRTDGSTVFLKLSDLSKPVDSDRYFTEKYKTFMEGVLRDPILHKPPSRYPMHSSKKDLK